MTMTSPASDREVSTADNQLITTDRLAANYGGIITRLNSLDARLSELPTRIDDDDTCGHWQDFIKELDDHAKAIEATREDVKAPFLAAGSIVDSFFKALATREPKRPGRAELIRARVAIIVENYLQRKATAERQRREAEARALREAEDRRRREAEEREAMARRAEERNRGAEAERQQFQADLAAKEAQCIADKAMYVEQSAQAPSADLARTRSAGGSLGTLTDKWQFEISDITAVKGAPIWAYVKREHKEAAIRAFMNANAPKQFGEGQEWQPLAGVRFYRVQKLQVRR